MLKGSFQLRYSRAIMGCTSALALIVGANPAYAQDGAAEAAAEEYDDDRIIVTGSRIQRRDTETDSPLVTVSAEFLQNSSSIAIDEQLKELPQFTGGQGGVSGATSVQALPTSSPGISTVNLRGLGSNRTLVLLDGRRMQPANASLVVDLNTIPRAAIAGVEVISGGAASTYGADAVAGVVNFQLKKNFNGVDIDAQYGVTERGDGQSLDLSALIGSDFADGRGNAIFGLNYSDRKVVFQRDIPFYEESYSDPDSSAGRFISQPGYDLSPDRNNTTFTYSPAGGRPSQTVLDSVFATYGVGSGEVSSSVAELYFNRGATYNDFSLFSSAAGAASGLAAPNYQGDLYPEARIDSSGNLRPNATTGYAQLPIRRFSMFGHSYYDISDSITVYAQGLFSQSDVTTQSTPGVSVMQWGAGIPFDSATCGAASDHLVPDDLCTVLSSRSNPDAPWELRQQMDFLGPQRLETSITTYEMMAGVRGELPFRDWNFDLFASHGRSEQNVTYHNFTDLDQYQALLLEPNFGENSSFFYPRTGLDGSCTSGLNPFIIQTVTQDCIDIISPELHTTTTFTQDQIELNLEGGILDLPAGEVRAALGAAYRENDFSYSPDSAFRSDNVTSLTVGVFSVLPASGSTDVREIYGEILVPVLADLPLIQELTLNAGARYSDYNTSGGVATWKLTGDWQVTDWLKIRGGYQYANRAPNIAELFQPGTYSTVGWGVHDPCSRLTLAEYGNVDANPDKVQVQNLCNAIAGTTNVINDSYTGNLPFFFPLGRDFTVGNPDVESEIAKTWTIGGVARVPTDGFGDFTLSIDYYNITVEGAIQAASTEFVYEQCFNADGTSNSGYDANNDFCQLIIRDSSTGFWLATRAEYQNLGSLATSGIDASLDWSIPAPGIGGDEGAVFINLAFNWLEKFEVQATPDGAVTNYTGTDGYGAQFDWRLNTTVGYDFGPGSLSLNWRHRPSLDDDAGTALPVEAYDIFDLSARYQLSDTFELRSGVDNLFDVDPPRVGVIPGVNSASGSTDTSAYDILGRRFYVGVKASF